MGDELVPRGSDDLALPESAADLEALTADDVRAQLRSTAASGSGVKLRTGGWLWAAAVLMTEAEYEAEVARVAEEWECQVRTVRSWRLKAEIRFRLEPPNPRAIAARKREAARATRVARGPGSVDNSKPERVTPTVVVGPSANGDPRNARPDRVTAAFTSEQLVLPLDEHRMAESVAELSDEVFAVLASAVDARRKATKPKRTKDWRDTPASEADRGCRHEKRMLKVYPYMTRCEVSQGGCGARVR